MRMSNENSEILDAAIRHMVYLERYKASEVKRIKKILDSDIIPDIEQKLQARLEKIIERGFDTGAITTRRLRELKAELKTLSNKMASRLEKELSGQLDLFAVDELAWQERAIVAATPAVKLGKPAAAQIAGLANKVPFAGFTLDEWAGSLSASTQRSLTQVIQRGIVQGQTTPQIMQAIRGTRAMNYKDGVMEVTRRQAEAITRSAVQHVANETRNELFKENADLLDGVQFVATLDSRTTEICASLDGKVFKIGEPHPQPPLHVNCRSAMIPVVKGAPRGVGTRASASGQVSAKTTYGDWLKRQPVAVQNDVLGVTKAKLFRNGGLKIDKFVGADLKPLTLDELREKESAAFKKANIE